jgi:hypothetical protein
MPGDRWLAPVLIALLAALLTALQHTTRRREKQSWSLVRAAKTAPATTRLLVAYACALGVIWLIPWSTHVTEASLTELVAGLIVVGAICLCALTGAIE